MAARGILSCGDARRSAETVCAGSPMEVSRGHYRDVAGDRETVPICTDGKGTENGRNDHSRHLIMMVSNNNARGL